MPDTKFTWARLREHVRKYFWIYFFGIVICLAGTNLLWTTTRPRVPNDRSVVVFMADSYSNPDPLDAIAADMLQRTQPLDDSLEQVEFLSLQFSDPSTDYTSSMLLMTRLSIGEGDAFFANQYCMDALVGLEVLEPLDEHVANGWMSEFDLEPFYVEVQDEETGESETYLAALKLDAADALLEMEAFNNRGAYLAVTNNGGNVETTLKALEFMMEDLMKESANAATEGSEPAA